MDLAYEGFVVRVESEDAATLRWLEEFLAPAFDARPCPRPDVVVRYDADAARARALARSFGGGGPSRPCFVLDSETVSLPAREVEGDLVLHDAAHGAFLRFGDGRLEIVADPAHVSRRLPLLRAVREAVSEDRRRRPGHGALHAAAFGRAGEVVAIAGPKGAGKTTLLVHALGDGAGSGNAFVGNDRLDVVVGDDVRARAMPTVVSLRPGTLARFPRALRGVAAVPRPSQASLAEMRVALAARGPCPADERLRVSPAQLCASLGVRAQAGGALRAVLLCEVVDDADVADDAVSVQRLEAAEAAERLDRCAYGLPEAGATATPFTHLVGASGRPVAARLGAAVAAQVPVLRCRLGARAYDRPFDVDALLGAVPGRSP